MKKPTKDKTDNLQTCEKDMSGNCVTNKVCRKDTEKKYCVGGKLASDINDKRFRGCPCKNSSQYDSLE